MRGKTLMELAVVVNLTIVHNDIAARAKHRLIPAFAEINDAETPMHQPYVA